jgi:hypothetical protein
MLQVKLPTSHTVRIPAGEARGFTPIRPRASFHIWPQRWWFWGQPAGGLPLLGRGEMEVSSRRVSSIRMEGKLVEIRAALEWGCGVMRCFHQFVWYGLGICGFNIRSCLFWGFNKTRLRGCSGFGRKLFRLGRLTSWRHFWLIRCLRDLVREGKDWWHWQHAPLGRRGSTFRPGPSAQQMAQLASLSGREVCPWQCSYDPIWRSLCKSRLTLFPSATTPAVRHVVAPTAAAHAAHEGLGTYERDGIPHTRRTGVHVRSFATYGRSTGSACIAVGPSVWRTTHRDPQPAELGERSHSGHLRPSCHRYDEMGWGTVLGRAPIAAAGAELHDPLDTNVQGFPLLSDDALRHPFSEILYQQPRSDPLTGEGVESHTRPAVKDRRALTVALQPSAVDRTDIKFSA